MYYGGLRTLAAVHLSSSLLFFSTAIASFLACVCVCVCVLVCPCVCVRVEEKGV
jgi:hypothetical protein